LSPGSTVSTDELMSYGLLTGDGYDHGTVKHGRGEYAFYDYRTGANHHVNSVEGFWRLFKRRFVQPTSRSAEASPELSKRVYFPCEPPEPGERDV
jgi:hypothetical protein